MNRIQIQEWKDKYFIGEQRPDLKSIRSWIGVVYSGEQIPPRKGGAWYMHVNNDLSPVLLDTASNDGAMIVTKSKTVARILEGYGKNTKLEKQNVAR